MDAVYLIYSRNTHRINVSTIYRGILVEKGRHYNTTACITVFLLLNTLNAALNPIRHLLALIGARHIVHASRIRVKNDTLCTKHYHIAYVPVATNTCHGRRITQYSTHAQYGYIMHIHKRNQNSEAYNQVTVWPITNTVIVLIRITARLVLTSRQHLYCKLVSLCHCHQPKYNYKLKQTALYCL
jgi:hypothetical protein